ncbi:type II toxin-antitoxin system VapC family toxin [Sandaracinobacteroides saxicola]|uniref:Ribonuclease VapC n=1 Tax=Sandaracinobacteroides saxicola TaxID=2759707 RepID=A0A7G5IJF2_9SPHN|nr:type II toxin-antitoxin system VapC family toxin [Sandaracinobacteroides saxicola]QMW23494.1 type II toxin-antitoxin system VapC family toxin [Sandaracinobacteroides saxicola]
MTDRLILLDSNICIYILQNASGPEVAQLSNRNKEDVAVSVISYAEVMLGLTRAPSDQLWAAEQLFMRAGVRNFTSEAAHIYATLPFRRNSFDRLIAAHALSLGAAIATNNPRDFADIPGLVTEDWTIWPA